MKKGWVKSKFGDVCQYRKDNGVHKNLQYVGMEHIGQGNGLLLGTIDSNSVLSTSFRFQKGDVLYGRLRPYLKKVCVAEFEGCCSTEIFPIFSEHIDASFLKYWLLTDKTTTAINNTCSGCRMPRGNMNEVLNFDFYYPPLSEQKEIVEYLDSSFAKIDKLKANAAKNLEEAKALFQSALKDALEPKEGWECRTIGEVCKLKSGNSKANKSPVGDLPYVKVADMNIKGNDTFIKHSSTYVDRAYNSKDIIPCNSVIFPKRGGAILTNKKRITECEICCDLNIMAVIPNEQILPKYLYFYFVGLDFSKLFNGATIPQINNCDIAPLQIPVSSISEQQSIVSFLDSLNEKVNTLQQNYSRICDECDALKQAILRQVFE